jgi:hypothetical protein
MTGLFSVAAQRSAAPLGRTSGVLLQRQCACGQHTPGGGECEECQREKKTLQRYGSGPSGATDGSPLVRQVLSSPGQSLDSDTRGFMESRFGRSFSSVRVHTNPTAAASAQAVNALAYTVGRDVVFNSGQFSPASTKGRQLLAHELTHVVQQGMAPHSEGVIYRAQQDVAAPAHSEPGRSDATSRLLALAAEAEQVQSQAEKVLASKSSGLGEEGGASSQAVHPVNHQYVQALAGLPAQLRSVASSTNEKQKEQVLSAFSAQKLDRAKSKLQNGAPEATAVIEHRSVGLAASPLQISSPRDRAEVEAERVAAAVVSGRPAPIGVQLPDSVLSRQGGVGVMAAGEGLLALEAGGAGEVEAATGPPGWIVGGVILLAAGVLIGTGYLMSRGRSREKTAEKAEPTTANPPPPPDLCKTAIKILTQYERLAEKFGKNLPAKRIEELNALRDSGQITINHLPGFLKSMFPGNFGDMTLAAIRALCKM